MESVRDMIVVTCVTVVIANLRVSDHITILQVFNACRKGLDI